MSKMRIVAMAFAFACVLLTGCAGVRSYRSVDLGRNLDAAALERYEDEWQALPAAEQAKHSVPLERSNWWPLGIIAYHRDASVTRMQTADGPVYHVSSGHGFGPLSLLCSISTHATYSATGERLNWMRMTTLIKGCLAMGHATDTKLADGRRERASSWHLVKHFFNIHVMDGHTYMSLFTVPNPLGLSFSGDHGE